MKRHSRFPRILFATILLSLSLAAFAPPAGATVVVNDVQNPKKAASMAEDIANWVKNNALLQGLLSAVNFLSVTTDTWLNEMAYSQDLSNAYDMTVRRIEAESALRRAQAENDAEIMKPLAKNMMRIARKNVFSESASLCNSIRLGQTSLTTKEWENAVARIAAESIAMRYRGAKDDGSGPAAASDALAARCEQKFGSSDDFPEQCVDKSTKSVSGVPIANADLNFGTLTGEQPLELPDFEEVKKDGVLHYVPVPKNTAQKFWVAGLYYCYNLAGPRPTLPKHFSPEDISKDAQWRTCATREANLIRPCANLLAHHTRPNSKQKELIAAHKEKCVAAERLGITLPESFEKCARGLSPYQAAYLEHSMCKNPGQYTAQKRGGAALPDMVRANAKCSMTWNLWQQAEIERQTAVIAGVPALVEARKCWAQTEK